MTNGSFPSTRMRRTRRADWSRRLVRETALAPDDLIWPLFLIEGKDGEEPLPSMPGVSRLTIDNAVLAARRARTLGIPALALFPKTPAKKRDAGGTEALHLDNLVNTAARAIKDAVPEVGVIVDVALDPYTDHGHDGLLGDGHILNDETVEVLAEQAVVQARAGADIVAPSDMMDGRVGAIRKALDDEGFTHIQIMAYAAKYASAYYGPFREAVGSGKRLEGDKKTYQMDPANGREALREIALDIDEGADSIIVKPGGPYLDIIARAADAFPVPVFGFQVSGEYAMIRAAADQGWLEGEAVMLESLLAFRRAGAAGILTYFAPDAAEILNS